MINYEMTFCNNINDTSTRITLHRIPLGSLADLNAHTDWSDDVIGRLLTRFENELCNCNVMPNLEFEQYNNGFIAHISNANNIVLGPADISQERFDWMRSDKFSIITSIYLAGYSEHTSMSLRIEFEDEHMYEK